MSLKAVGLSHWQRYYILLIGGNPCGLFLWRPTGGASFSCSATTWVLGLKTTVRSRPAGSATDRAEIKTTALWWFSTLVLQFSFTEIFNRHWHKIKRRRVVWLFCCSYTAYSENLNGNLYFPFKLWTIIPQSQKQYYRKSSRAESVGCAHEKSAKPSLPTANILLCRHHRLLFLSVWCLHMLTIRDLVGKTWLRGIPSSARSPDFTKLRNRKEKMDKIVWIWWESLELWGSTKSILHWAIPAYVLAVRMTRKNNEI